MSVHLEVTTSDEVSVIPFNTIGPVYGNLYHRGTNSIRLLYYNITTNQVHLCRSLRYRMANADMTQDQVPSVNNYSDVEKQVCQDFDG